jgi:hypothetical protein
MWAVIEMKIECPFCNVGYCVRNVSARSFECAVCGHCWRAQAAPKNSRGWFFLLGCVVLLFVILAFAALVRRTSSEPAGPIVVQVDSAAASDAGLLVSGIASNKSDKLQGMPDLVVVLKDARGAELLSQKFAPPAPLLDAGESAAFSVRVGNVPPRAAKIAVELSNN